MVTTTPSPLRHELAAIVADDSCSELERVDRILDALGARLTSDRAVTTAHMAYWNLAPGDAQYRELINGGIRARRGIEAALAIATDEDHR